jgi:mRNA interferase RelE/StbE
LTKPAAGDASELARAHLDLARVAAAWSQLPAAIRAAVLALVDAAWQPLDLAAALDRAFDRLDRQAGGHNLVSLADLRGELGAHDRAAVDAELHRLRQAGRYSLAAAEGRHGLTPAERDAAIADDGRLLAYVSRVDDPCKNVDIKTIDAHTDRMATVALTPEAARQFDRLPRPIKARVARLRERLEHWPAVSGAKPLTGNLAGWYRLRTGDYRVRFRVAGERVIVDKIGHRSEFYEG